LNAVGPIGRTSSPVRAGAVAPTYTRDTIESLQQQNALNVLPDRTGGRTVVNTNAPDSQVQDIFTESASYYLIGFKPANIDSGRTFHPVSVKLNRRGLTLHTRNGYAIPAAEAAERPGSGGVPASMRRAVGGLLPSTSIPIELNAAAFAASGSRGSSVTLVVALGDLAALAGGRANVPLDVVANAFDRNGQPRTSARQTLRLSVPVTAQAQRRRIEILSRLDLPPGDYEIRVGVTAGDRATSASVFSYLAVPAFESEPLAMSNVIVRAVPPTATAPGDFLSKVVPLVPTAQREFASTDRLIGYLRLYQGTRRTDPLAPVELRTSVIDAEGKPVASASDVLAAGQFSNGRTADQYITLPLATLARGEYLLRLEARMGERAAGRALRFSVQ
jgi:hypothetical protein